MSISLLARVNCWATHLHICLYAQSDLLLLLLLLTVRRFLDCSEYPMSF